MDRTDLSRLALLTNTDLAWTVWHRRTRARDVKALHGANSDQHRAAVASTYRAVQAAESRGLFV